MLLLDLDLLHLTLPILLQVDGGASGIGRGSIERHIDAIQRFAATDYVDQVGAIGFRWQRACHLYVRHAELELASGNRGPAAPSKVGPESCSR